MICGFYHLYSDGKEAELRERLQRLPKAATGQSNRFRTEGDDDDDSEVSGLKTILLNDSFIVEAH